MAAEYGGRNVSGPSNGEQETENINGPWGGLVRIVLNGWVTSELKEGNGAEKEFGDSRCWLAWKLRKRKMVASSFRSEGRRWGGCHCRKCISVSQQESNGNEDEEIQSRTAKSGSLAENCYVVENSAEERRIMANLEKTMQVALSFASGGEEPENSLWIVQILLERMIRERTEIGKVVKALAKFQWREILHGLVKLGDLEDLAYPPTLGSYATPSSPHCLQNVEGMQRNAKDLGNPPSGGLLRPEDSLLGILSPGQN